MCETCQNKIYTWNNAVSTDIQTHCSCTSQCAYSKYGGSHLLDQNIIQAETRDIFSQDAWHFFSFCFIRKKLHIKIISYYNNNKYIKDHKFQSNTSLAGDKNIYFKNSFFSRSVPRNKFSQSIILEFYVPFGNWSTMALSRGFGMSFGGHYSGWLSN